MKLKVGRNFLARPPSVILPATEERGAGLTETIAFLVCEFSLVDNFREGRKWRIRNWR